MAAGDAQKGADVFHDHCDFCHSFRLEDGNGTGPNLSGLAGRKAGTFADFEYSAAMKNSGIVWNAQTLTQFIQAPDTVVPGTKMVGFRRVDAEDIDDLIAYLMAAGSPEAAPTGNLAPPAGATPAPQSPGPPTP
jgi:cytochrome c